MLKILLKKQLTEVFRNYFYDEKKNKPRSKASTIGLIVFFVILMVGVVGGVFTAMAVMMCEPLSSAGFDWLYFLILGATATLLGSFGSVFNTYSGLYLSKDNDLLLSMPIPVKDIIMSRLLNVYLMGLMYSAVVTVPSVIVYLVVSGGTVRTVICNILYILMISIAVLILSCALGYVVAKISVKLKRKSFITVLASLAFFGLYYLVYFKAQDIINNLIANAADYGSKIKSKAFILYAFGSAASGNILCMLVISLCIIAIAALTYYIISHSFIKIAVTSAETGKVKYKEKREKRKSVSSAVFYKELKRFTSSANYMLNCGLGILMLVIAGVLLLIKGDFLLSVFDKNGLGDFISPNVIICAAICIICAMNDISAPSISLEGKSLWLYKSLPVKAETVLYAKVRLHFVLTCAPAVFCCICACVALKPDFVSALFMFATVLLFTLFCAQTGLMLGLKLPNLNWTNEISPIKQGLPVMLSMLIGMVLSVLIAAGDILFGAIISDGIYLAVTTLLLAACCAAMRLVIRKNGVKMFNEL